jgi:hypothetical protein
MGTRRRRYYKVTPYQTVEDEAAALQRVAELVCRHKDPPLEVAKRFADYHKYPPRRRLKLFKYVKELKETIR